MFLIRCPAAWSFPDRCTARTDTRLSGYTIVELMVAITISLIILAGLVSVFANNSRMRGEIERANQQTENGRYALQLIIDDLHNAGYLAEFNPGPLATPATKPDACDASPAGLKNALPLAVQGYDNGTNAPTCLADLKAGTDILVVRHASTCAVGSAGCDANVAGAPYFQTSGCNSQAELASGNVATFYVLDTNSASFTLHKKDCVTLANQYQYRTHIYFVANDDQAGDGIPTLMRAELGAGSPSIVALVEGVEQLQIEYGLDTSVPTTGAPAVYTADPDSYNGCAATPSVCVGYWRSTVAAKINVLTRNTAQTRGYVDGKVYTLGLKANGTANTFGPYNDAYKRHTNESVVKLNNPAGRNTP
jgi:type IV pilus assembly protein PilW